MAGVRLGSRCEGFCSEEGPHCCFEQSARNPTINLIHQFGNPLGIPYPSFTAYLSRAYVTQESVSLRIFVSKKGIICVCPTDVRTRNLRQKAERGKFTGSESTTRFPRASCFEKPTHSVPGIWGRMYDIPTQSANGTRNGMRNRIPVQPRKARRN